MNYTYEIIRSVVKAFEERNTEEILSQLADDVEWHIMGQQMLKGKDAILQFIMSDEYKRHPMMAITQTHFIVYGDEGVVAGDMTTTGDDGIAQTLHCCEIFEVEDGKMRKIFTYMVGGKP